MNCEQPLIRKRWEKQRQISLKLKSSNRAIIGTVTGNYLENPGKFKRYGIEVGLTKEVGDMLQDVRELGDNAATDEMGERNIKLDASGTFASK